MILDVRTINIALRLLITIYRSMILRSEVVKVRITKQGRMLHLSYDKFFKRVDWLQAREFLEIRELLYLAANQHA